MNPRSKLVLGILVVLNCIVLLGQVWPEGAPPFARWVNIGFLVLNLVVLALSLRGTRATTRG